jgi:hypothetical protein
MNELWIVVAGIVISAIMGGLKAPLALLKRQHPLVKSGVVVVIATALYFVLKMFGLAESSGATIPVAALVAMGVRELGVSLKAVVAEDPTKKAARLNQ